MSRTRFFWGYQVAPEKEKEKEKKEKKREKKNAVN
jgi:hypothetical protein